MLALTTKFLHLTITPEGVMRLTFEISLLPLPYTVDGGGKLICFFSLLQAKLCKIKQNLYSGRQRYTSC